MANPQAPGVPLTHRFLPTEAPRVVKEPDAATNRIASEVGFNPVTTLRIGDEKVFVRAVNNTQSRYLKPVPLNGTVVLPVRGERVFEFSDEMRNQVSSKVATLAKPLTEPEKTPDYLGVQVPSIKPRGESNPQKTTKLLSDLATTTAAVRNFLTKQVPGKIAPKPPVTVPPLEIQPVTPQKPPQANTAVVQPSPAIQAPLPVVEEPKTAPNAQPQPNLVQVQPAATAKTELTDQREDSKLEEQKKQLNDLQSDLGSAINKQDSLLSQILATPESTQIEASINKLSEIKELHNQLSSELMSLKKAASKVSPEPALQTEWTGRLKNLEEALGKQKIISDYLEAKANRLNQKAAESRRVIQKAAQASAELPKEQSSEITPNEDLAKLPELAGKLIAETTQKAKVLINYKPIHLPTPPVPTSIAPPIMPQPAITSPAAVAPTPIPARLEIVETVPASEKVEPQISIPATLTPSMGQDQIASVVTKQLETEKKRIEEEIKEQLKREAEAKSEEQKKAAEAAVAAAQSVLPKPGVRIGTLNTTPIEERPTLPKEEAIVQPKPFDKEEAQKQIDQETIQKSLVQAEGKVSNLALEGLTQVERDKLMERLRSLNQQSEVLRQYSDLQYQREKERISQEIKGVIKEAEEKAGTAAAKEKLASERAQQTEAEQKAKVAQEVKELVEKEKAKKAKARNIVQAQPAFGKMIPPRVAFPNVINGIVRDAKGLLLSGVVMIIKDHLGEPVRALKTNKIGQFVISTPLPNGTYQIELEKENTEFDIVQVELKGEVMKPIEIRSL